MLLAASFFRFHASPYRHSQEKRQTSLETLFVLITFGAERYITPAFCKYQSMPFNQA